LQCYCNTPENFHPHTTFLETGNFTTEFNEGGKTIKYSAPVCLDFKSLQLTGKIFGTGIAFVIIAVNLVLKTVIIKLITWIKVDTESEQLTAISTGVFIA